MGEAKRRQESMGERYGKEQYILPWLPITKSQADWFMSVTTKGAWIGIGIMVAVWLTVRLIGPAFGWWTLS